MVPANRLVEAFSNHRIIKVECAPHSSCSWFTESICKSFPGMQCIKDARCDQRIPDPTTDVLIAKTGTLPHPPFSSDGRWKHVYRKRYRIYNILYVREPFALFATMGKEKWRGNCGGFHQKFLTIDRHLMYAFAQPQKYGAVVFAENFYQDPYRTMKEMNMTLNLEAFTPYRAVPTVRWEHDVVCSLMPFHCALYHGTTADELGRLGQLSLNRTLAARVHRFPLKADSRRHKMAAGRRREKPS